MTFKSYIPTKKLRWLRILEKTLFVLLILQWIPDGKRGSGLSDIIYIPLWISSVSYLIYLFGGVFFMMSMIWKADIISNNTIVISNESITIKETKYPTYNIDKIKLHYPAKVNKGKGSLYKNYIIFNSDNKEINVAFALEKGELWKFFEFLRNRDKNKFLIVLT